MRSQVKFVAVVKIKTMFTTMMSVIYSHKSKLGAGLGFLDKIFFSYSFKTIYIFVCSNEPDFIKSKTHLTLQPLWQAISIFFQQSEG